MKEGSVIKRDGIDFNEADIELVSIVSNKARDIYNFFKYLKETRDLPFAMVLIKSDNLKETILERKRDTDVFVDLDIEDMNLIFLPITKENECDGFIRRMMSDIKDNSGEFASVLQIKKNVGLEEAVFPLLIDYLMILKQPREWRTGQISYKEV